MKKLLFILSIAILFHSCKDEPPVLPGLTKSRITFVTDPDSSVIFLNNQPTNKITPDYVDDLEPGFYKIDFSRETYLDTFIYHIIGRNVSETVTVEMREDPAYWWKVYDQSNSPAGSGSFGKIIVDNENNKWITTRGRGLIKFDDLDFTIFNTTNSGIPSDIITDLAVLPDGIKWIATREGFTRFDGIGWLTYNMSNAALIDHDFSAIAIDQNNVIWLGTFQNGLIKFDGVSFTNYTYFNSGLPSNLITDLAVDQNNILWITTDGGGLASYDNFHWKVYNSISSPLSNNLSTILIDKNNIQWIALRVGGFVKVENLVFNYFNEFNSPIPGAIVTDIAADNFDNSIWLSTSGGIARYYNGKWVVYNAMNSGMPSNSAASIAVDLNRVKWIGTAGLAKYIGGTRP
jgi:ligand-binding sensor domain-containing protein